MITVLFDCRYCGLQKAKAFVRGRRPQEEAGAWLQEAGQAIDLAHRLLQPQCSNLEASHLDVFVPNDHPQGWGYEISEVV